MLDSKRQRHLLKKDLHGQKRIAQYAFFVNGKETQKLNLKRFFSFSDSNKVKENGDSWENYLGDENDPKSSIMIRFPDGKREKKEIPCSSQFRVSIPKLKL